MGTRADFYIGTGSEAEWLGSIAFDGYRIEEMTLEHSYKNLDSLECWAIKSATTEADFRMAVTKLLELNDDGTAPEQGWPWPWGNSCGTDRTYAFESGACQCFHWGAQYNQETGEKIYDGPGWPDMRSRQNVTFGKRSGVIIIRS